MVSVLQKPQNAIEARVELGKGGREGKSYPSWKPIVRTLQLENPFGVLGRVLKLFIHGLCNKSFLVTPLSPCSPFLFKCRCHREVATVIGFALRL